MTKKDAIRVVVAYLKSHGFRYVSRFSDGYVQITLTLDAKNAPEKRIECGIWFYEEGMEARVYYSALGAEICRKSGRADELLRILNFINACVFLSNPDGEGMLYEQHMLYTPRIYLTADDCFDIMITTIIPYDFFDLAPTETCDYVAEYCPELLDRLAPPIYSVLLGKETADRAIAYLKENCGGS